MEDHKTILIVDDAQDLTKIMSDMLDFKGYRTLTAINAREAIELALKEHPDLIIMDVRMPEMNGYEAIREIRKDDWGKSAKFLILTATDFLDDRPTDLGLAANDYLAKSVWGIESVAERVKQKLTE